MRFFNLFKMDPLEKIISIKIKTNILYIIKIFARDFSVFSYNSAMLAKTTIAGFMQFSKFELYPFKNWSRHVQNQSKIPNPKLIST